MMMMMMMMMTLSYSADALVNGSANSESCTFTVKRDFTSFRSAENSRDVSVYILKKGNVVATCRCVENDQYSCPSVLMDRRG